MEVLKARVRLRERERNKKRDIVAKKEVKESPVDLMVNSPIMTGDGFPSPNLPRGSESVVGSPVIGTPIETTTVGLPRRTSVTISGAEALAAATKRTSVDKVLGSPLAVKSVNRTEEEAEETEEVTGDVLESPILVKKSVNGTEKNVSNVPSPVFVKKSADADGETQASTGLGIEDSSAV
jgi:hypothetical protein